MESYKAMSLKNIFFFICHIHNYTVTVRTGIQERGDEDYNKKGI